MAIGPSLPPHLAKRKRSSSASSEGRESSSGADKRNRTIGPALPTPQPGSAGAADTAGQNPDRIDLSASDDEDVGPRLPGAVITAATRPIGPAMPPPEINPDEIDLDDSDFSDNGPAPSGPSKANSTATSTARRSIGPSLPPGITDDSSDSDDDDMGPAPPPPPGAGPSSGAAVSVFDRPDHDTDFNSTSTSTGPQREAWMLAPPDGADWATKIDPTKLRNRRFVSGPRAGGGGSKGGGSGSMSSEWTETPEEKRRRLENAVMGVSSSETAARSAGARGPSSVHDSRSSSQRKQDKETERRIREYDERTRGESLVKAHQRTRDTEQDDDPSKRAFDREKDIGGAPKISNAQKREMMNRAADFGSRFSKGSYL